MTPWVLIVLLILYCHHQLRCIESFETVSVRFLSIDEAKRVFMSTDFDYHKHFRYAESVARTRKRLNRDNYLKEVLDIYKQACLPFKKSEQQSIKALLKAWNIARGPVWRFIKMKDEMDFSFPYTIGDVIVLPERLIDSICKDQCSDDNMKTLIHEQIHVTQRQHFDIFRSYYEDKLGFKYFPNLVIPEAIRNDMITNPDGLDTWTSAASGREYYYCLMLERDGRLSKAAYPVVYSKSTAVWTLSSSGRRSLDDFASFHGGVSACYHPHEVYAYLLSDKLCGKERNIKT